MSAVPPSLPQCKLLAGAPALVAQLLLAVLAFSSLVYKRHRERPQRAPVIWSMDVTKQVFSSGAGHICGIIIAMAASSRVGHATSECAWYFVAYSFDTTLGVTLAIWLHRAAVRGALRLQGGAGPAEGSGLREWAAVIANCGEPPSWRRWGIQMAEWVAATVSARAICGLIVLSAHALLTGVARLGDRMFLGHPTAQLFSVMIMCPLLMNMLQAWIQDAVLKLKSGTASQLELVEDGAAGTRLLPMERHDYSDATDDFGAKSSLLATRPSTQPPLKAAQQEPEARG